MNLTLNWAGNKIVDKKEGFWHTLSCAPCNRKLKLKIALSYF